MSRFISLLAQPKMDEVLFFFLFSFFLFFFPNFLQQKFCNDLKSALLYHEQYFELSDAKSKNAIRQRLEYYTLETEYNRKTQEAEIQKQQSELLKIELGVIKF